MMRLKQSLENLVKCGLFLNFLFLLCLITNGCFSSTNPTYTKEKVAASIQEICRNEYKFDVKVKLVGETLWFYIPVEDIFTKADKPRKNLNLFKIEDLDSKVGGNTLLMEYAIKDIKPEEKTEDYTFNKEISERFGAILRVTRRVLFSIDNKERDEPKFLCMVMADIKNGFEIKTIVYYLDLKKVSYGIISSEEYQHRNVQEVNVDPTSITKDKQGQHLEYKDIALRDFIIEQIKQRIKLKFGKPELKKNADIDKEILKIIANTIKIYDLRDFHEIELKNKLTDYTIILNRPAILEKAND